jgi:ribosome-binding factor A
MRIARRPLKSRRAGRLRRPSRYGAGMTGRMRRVNESLRQVLSEALLDLKDPRIGFVTVTGVDTAPDLRQATVYVSVLGSEKKRNASMRGLDAAHGVLQARISRELRLKRTPTLTFEYDHAVAHGVAMSKLIDELAPADDDGR